MSARRNNQTTSKKEQIIAFYLAGMNDLSEIAKMVGSRASYVASALQAAGLLSGYFDLYTTSAQPMNVFSSFFAGKLGYKNVAAAQQSVALLEQMYRQFAEAEDRAGQHHTLMLALTMFNRARWIDKPREAEIFRQWLLSTLHATEISAN